MQEQGISTGAASRRRKWFFWIILGALSTFFAEVTAGSTPLPFFSPAGLLLVFPLYFLHTLFFFCVVWCGRSAGPLWERSIRRGCCSGCMRLI